MQRECLYFVWEFEKCFKYVVKDRPRKKYVYGIAYCDEPGVPAGILKTWCNPLFGTFLHQ